MGFRREQCLDVAMTVCHLFLMVHTYVANNILISLLHSFLAFRLWLTWFYGKKDGLALPLCVNATAVSRRQAVRYSISPGVRY